MNLLEFVEFEEQIGRIWHRLIGTGSVTAGYHHYPDAAVSLEDIRVALGVFSGIGRLAWHCYHHWNTTSIWTSFKVTPAARFNGRISFTDRMQPRADVIAGNLGILSG